MAVWQQHVDGLWKAAELRLMRGKLQAAIARATDAEAQTHQLKNDVTRLSLEVAALSSEREELRASRERLLVQLHAEADKAERMRVLAVELSSVSSG